MLDFLQLLEAYTYVVTTLATQFLQPNIMFLYINNLTFG